MQLHCVHTLLSSAFCSTCPCSSAEPLAGFRAAVKRSFSRRQESVTSGGGGFVFQRQASTMSQLSQEDVAPPGLTDHLSRFSMEDLPVVASPSPFPGRSAFPGPTDEFDDEEEAEDDIDVEVSGWVWFHV